MGYCLKREKVLAFRLKPFLFVRVLQCVFLIVSLIEKIYFVQKKGRKILEESLIKSKSMSI